MGHITVMFGLHSREGSGSGGAVDVVVIESGTVGTQTEEIFMALRCCRIIRKNLRKKKLRFIPSA